MSAQSFEFSVADAATVPTKKASQVAKNPKLDISLDELINREKKEKREARKSQEKEKAKGKTSKPVKTAIKKTDKNTKKPAAPQKRSNRSNDITVKVDTRNTHKNEFKISIPDRIIRDLLEKAGVNTSKYNVSVYAIPRGRN